MYTISAAHHFNLHSTEGGSYLLLRLGRCCWRFEGHEEDSHCILHSKTIQRPHYTFLPLKVLAVFLPLGGLHCPSILQRTQSSVPPPPSCSSLLCSSCSVPSQTKYTCTNKTKKCMHAYACIDTFLQSGLLFLKVGGQECLDPHTLAFYSRWHSFLSKSNSGASS